MTSKKRLKKEMGVLEENGDICYGARVFEKIWIFYPISIIYKILFVVYVANYIYKKIAQNSYLISGSETCDI
jgi:hypothetical protein